MPTDDHLARSAQMLVDATVALPEPHLDALGCLAFGHARDDADELRAAWWHALGCLAFDARDRIRRSSPDAVREIVDGPDIGRMLGDDEIPPGAR